ncbi:hypothetical protein GGI15_002989 [Coemansia interrupta]|uniref:DNA repair protein SWI5 homolog n=1 Tax=Coemansia interrupta TaxID=1126814 RepID=A0A9W8HEN2_9FUNG|nr:hypothetical protein GGI15_002989 [Coemansia interrupta]
MNDASTPTKRTKRAAEADDDDLGESPSALISVPETDAVLSSPLPCKEDSYKTELQIAVAVLRKELEAQNEERARLLSSSGMTMDEALHLSSVHMERLHTYNDIKDAGQVLFGKLAELRGKTAREMHEEYGVQSDD